MSIILYAVLFAFLSIVDCKYQIEMQSFEVISQMTNKDIIDPGTMRLKQELRNEFMLSGYFIVNQNIVPSDTLKLEYHQKTITGRYIQLAITTMTICESTKMKFYPKLQKASNFPPSGTCPILKGNYTVNHLIIDESFFPSILPKGENFIMATFFLNGKPAYGLRLYTNIKEV